MAELYFAIVLRAHLHADSWHFGCSGVQPYIGNEYVVRVKIGGEVLWALSCRYSDSLLELFLILSAICKVRRKKKLGGLSK